MSAKPIGKMIGGMLGGMFRDTTAQPTPTAASGDVDAGAGISTPHPQASTAAGQITTTTAVTGEGSAVAAAAAEPVAGAEPAAAAAAESVAGAEPAAALQDAEPTQIDLDVMEERLIDAMRTVYDPEIPVDIYELGLIYSLRVRPGGVVDIEMTLTTPNCPVAGSMPGMVENVARMVDGVTDVHVELVWEPIWNPEMMSEAARLQLNMY